MAQRRQARVQQTLARRAETFWVWVRSLLMLSDTSLVCAHTHWVSGYIFWSGSLSGRLRRERSLAEVGSCYLDTCKQPCWQQEEFGFSLAWRGLGSQLAGAQLGRPSDSAIFTLLSSKVYLLVASSLGFVSSINLSGVWAAAKPKPSPAVQAGEHLDSRTWFQIAKAKHALKSVFTLGSHFLPQYTWMFLAQGIKEGNASLAGDGARHGSCGGAGKTHLQQRETCQRRCQCSRSWDLEERTECGTLDQTSGSGHKQRRNLPVAPGCRSLLQLWQSLLVQSMLDLQMGPAVGSHLGDLNLQWLERWGCKDCGGEQAFCTSWGETVS